MPMDEEDQYWKQVGALTPSSMKQARSNISRGKWINQRARLVLGSYRKDDVSDPEVFISGLIAILQQYSDKVIEQATSMTSGVQTLAKFPPSIAEFKEFCEELHRRSGYAAAWDARSREQLEERAQYEQQAKDESTEYRRAVVERLQRELAEAFAKPPPPNSYKALTAKHGHPLGPFEHVDDKWNKGHVR